MPHALEPGKIDIVLLGKIIRRLIAWIAWALAAAFTWVQFKAVFDVISSQPLDFGPLLKVSPEIIRRIVIAFYYIFWIAGSTFDTDVQQNIYIWSRTKRSELFTAIFFIVAFGAIAALLLWSASDDRRFAACLSLFFLANIAGFQYITHFIKPIIAATRLSYRTHKQNFNTVRLDAVASYMTGTWQWWRFAAGALLIAIVDLLSFSPPVRAAVAYLVASVTSVNKEIVDKFVPSLFFLVFVATVEGWIWYMRGRLSVTLVVLEDLEGTYRLERRAS